MRVSVMKKRVLILCTGNSCRSQMAEGFWRAFGGEEWDVFSAGLIPKGVNPLAIQVMGELGVDIRRQKSESVEALLDQEFDLVLTVCSNAERSCPTFARAARREHWPFDDPDQSAGAEEQRLAVFRRVRDQIRAAVRNRIMDPR
jgi:arsenate reductase